MATFAIFNYQFAKIIKRNEEGRLFPDEEGEGKDNFSCRQEILGQLLDEDYRKENPIVFKSQYGGDKEYIHQHLIRPTDGIYVMRVANRHVTMVVTQDWKEIPTDDYQNCLVIIDDRPGIQRMLIEQKKTAFQNVKQLAGIIEWTLKRILRRHDLDIELMHLQDPRVFWDIVKDRKSYPDGFYKITFHLPHLNLERLKKVFDKVLVMSRKVFDSDLEWSYKAQKGGELPLDENNEQQSALIEWMMSEVGSENIKLYPNTAKRKAIIVGENSFLAVGISDTVIRRLTEEAVSGDLFGSKALDVVKVRTKTGIDLQE